MDFGLTDDQRDIQRTARELLADRSRSSACASTPRRARPTRTCGSELCGLGWPGIAVSEEHGGQGLGAVELAILCEELGRAVRRVPFLPTALAATLHRARRLAPSSSERWLPRARVAARRRRAWARADGAATRDRRRRRAGLRAASRTAARALRRAGEATSRRSTRSTRPARRRASSAPGGEALAGDVAGGAGPRAGRDLRRARRRVRPRAGDDARVRQGAQAVRHAGRRLPGRLAPLRADAARHREGARRRRRSRRGRPTPTPSAWPRRPRWPRPPRRTPGASVTAAAIQLHGGIGFTWEADVHWLFKRAQVDAALLGGGGTHRARIAAIAAARAGAMTTA